MRESLMYGSVRGARGNSRPYRDMLFCCGAFGRSWHEAAEGHRAEQCPLCPDTSDFDLLSDGKRIIDLDSEISDRTFHFLVAKQKLDRTQVAGATVDQGRLRAAERVRAKDMRVHPMPAIHSATSRAYCRVVMASPTRRRL